MTPIALSLCCATLATTVAASTSSCSFSSSADGECDANVALQLGSKRKLSGRPENDAALAKALQEALSTADEIMLRNATDLPGLDDAVASALTLHDYSIIKVKMQNWKVERDEISGDPPYVFQFEDLGNGSGQYVEHESVILVSANPSSYMEAAGINWMAPPASDPAVGDLREFSALGFGDSKNRCSAKEASANRQAKHVVIYANYMESTYFAHAVANVLPRLAAVIPGARNAGYKISVVMPDSNAFSPNTKLLIEALGAEFLSSPPSTPHQSIGVGLLAPWDHCIRAELWQEFRSALIPAEEKAPDCSSHTKNKLFASRKHGARNGRWTPGTELLENKLQSKGFEIADNLGELPLRDLARRLYKTCTLAGFAGGNLLNLMFLPPNSTIIEYNPMHIYADRWLFAHSLGFHFHEPQVPADGISEDDSEKLAAQAALL